MRYCSVLDGGAIEISCTLIHEVQETWFCSHTFIILYNACRCWVTSLVSHVCWIHKRVFHYQPFFRKRARLRDLECNLILLSGIVFRKWFLWLLFGLLIVSHWACDQRPTIGYSNRAESSSYTLRLFIILDSFRMLTAMIRRQPHQISLRLSKARTSTERHYRVLSKRNENAAYELRNASHARCVVGHSRESSLWINTWCAMNRSPLSAPYALDRSVTKKRWNYTSRATITEDLSVVPVVGRLLRKVIWKRTWWHTLTRSHFRAPFAPEHSLWKVPWNPIWWLITRKSHIRVRCVHDHSSVKTSSGTTWWFMTSGSRFHARPATDRTRVEIRWRNTIWYTRRNHFYAWYAADRSPWRRNSGSTLCFITARSRFRVRSAIDRSLWRVPWGSTWWSTKLKNHFRVPYATDHSRRATVWKCTLWCTTTKGRIRVHFATILSQTNTA